MGGEGALRNQAAQSYVARTELQTKRHRVHLHFRWLPTEGDANFSRRRTAEYARRGIGKEERYQPSKGREQYRTRLQDGIAHIILLFKEGRASCPVLQQPEEGQKVGICKFPKHPQAAVTNSSRSSAFLAVLATLASITCPPHPDQHQSPSPGANALALGILPVHKHAPQRT